MIEPRALELMNLVIDGVASPAQRAELDHHLSAHPEARSFYDSLSQLARRLDADPIPAPPDGLEPRILDAIHGLPAPTPSRTREKPTSWLRSFLAPTLRPWSTFGLGLAAGLLILVAIQYGHPNFWNAGRDIDSSNVSGSMVPVSGRKALASVVVETQAGTVDGSARVYRTGANVAVEVELQSTVAVEWVLSFDADAWTLLRVERQGTATMSFAANRDSVRGFHTGEGGVTLVFSGAPEAAQSVVLKILEGGQTVFEGVAAAVH